MKPSLRTVLTVAVLLAVLSGASWVSRAPTIGRRGTEPNIPPLIRTGRGELAVTAEAVLIKRIASGEVLFERNAGERLPIASLTKLMSALLLEELGQPLAEVEFSDGAKRAGDPDDKRSAVRAGDRLRAEEVLQMMLVSSDNDAAYAAAEHVALARQPPARDMPFAGRIALFVELMNARTRELHLESTHFANPAGRDDPENYSTAQDITRLAAFIVQSKPELWAASRIREAFAFGEGGRRYSLVNTNPLLAEYPAIYGSKTGFDDESRGTLLILYQIARNDLISVVLLRSGDRFGDGRSAIQWLESNFVLESE